jgi:hypothetical protein
MKGGKDVINNRRRAEKNICINIHKNTGMEEVKRNK